MFSRNLLTVLGFIIIITLSTAYARIEIGVDVVVLAQATLCHRMPLSVFDTEYTLFS